MLVPVVNGGAVPRSIWYVVNGTRRMKRKHTHVQDEIIISWNETEVPSKNVVKDLGFKQLICVRCVRASVSVCVSCVRRKKTSICTIQTTSSFSIEDVKSNQKNYK